MHRTQLETRQSGIAAPQASRILHLPPLQPDGRARRDPARNSRTAQLAHDVRNLISALDLYCDLLASPGVLAPGFGHYADELRSVAGSGARLIEALAGSRNSALSRYPHSGPSPQINVAPLRRKPFFRTPFPDIEDLASELIALEGSLRTLAGPEVRLEIECAPCAGRLAMNSEDLLRILFNLVANAVEAMAGSPAELRRRPFVRITAQRGGAASFLARRDRPHSETPDSKTVVLSVRDNGPGITAAHLPHIFDAGFSTRRNDHGKDEHGLGLAIVSQLVAGAGGAVRAVSPSGLGARFDIELPILGAEAPVAQLELASPGIRREIPQLQQISAQIGKEA